MTPAPAPPPGRRRRPRHDVGQPALRRGAPVPRARGCASWRTAAGEVKGALRAAALRAARRSRTPPGPMAHLVAELAVTFLLMAARAASTPTARPCGARRTASTSGCTSRAPGPRRCADGPSASWASAASARRRRASCGPSARACSSTTRTWRPPAVRAQGRRAGDARPPPARVRVPRPRRRPHRRDARPPRPRRAAPPARRRHRRERGPRRDRGPRRPHRGGPIGPAPVRPRRDGPATSPSRCATPCAGCGARS